MTTPIPSLPAMPCDYLASLIFGENADDAFPHSEVLSRAPGDIAQVKIIHLSLGQVIIEADPRETVFHVSLYPQSIEHNEPHAELWMAREWRESNARLTRMKELSALARETRGRKEEISRAAMQGLEGRIGPARAELLGNEIAEAIMGNADIKEVLVMLKLEDLLEKFKTQ